MTTQNTSESSQALNLVTALISHSFDRDGEAREAILTSLAHFGRKSPLLVLSNIHAFLAKHQKIEVDHRVALLRTLNDVLTTNLNEIDSSTAGKIILLASDELTKPKKLSHEWQSTASMVLVTMGNRFINEVIDELSKKYVPGVLPNYYVVHTLGRLAAANVTGCMEHMGRILSTTLTLLGLAKHESMRLVFATTLSSFCEAIIEHAASNQSTTSETSFSREVYGSYEVLSSMWMQTRDTKVLHAVVGALGKMCHLVSTPNLEVNAPKFVAVLLNLYRRQTSSRLPITEALCDVITAVTALKSTVLEPNLDQLIGNLHAQICNAPDVKNTDIVKNYNEVLRCFGILATCCSEILIGIILQKAELKEEKVRCGNLVILRHIINSNPAAMESRQDFIVTGFLKHLHDPSVKVRENMAKLVIAMATHGYLLREGGHEYVKFITLQCSHPGEPPKGDELRNICDEILNLITTTVQDMEQVLWPHLFEFVCKSEYSGAVGVVARSLDHIAQKKIEGNSPDYIINFKETVNIPSPVSLFSRWLVIISQPLRPRNHTRSVLSLILNFAPNIHGHLVEVMNSVVPKLQQFLEENQSSDEWPQQQWEALLLKLLLKSLDAVSDEEWTTQIGQAISSQWPLYDMPDQLPYKNFSYKCLGVVLRKSTNKQFVETYLATLFLCVQHCHPLEREGAGVCLGYCGSSHLDATLAKIHDFIKSNIRKKESSYLNFFKSEKSLTEVAQMKGTMALSCGYIALYAPRDLIASRVETTIMKMLAPLFKGVKDPAVRVDFVRSVDLIAQSVAPGGPSGSTKGSRVFVSRDDLLARMMKYLDEDGRNRPSDVKAAVYNSIASLVKLEPVMRDGESASLVEKCLQHLVTIPPLEADSQLMQECTSNLQSMLFELIKMRPNSHGLHSIFKHFEIYMRSEKEFERQRSVEMIGNLLISYSDYFALSESNRTLLHLGAMMARLIPCCSDPNPNIRIEALMCVRQLLIINNKYNGINEESSKSSLEVLEEVGAKLTNHDAQIMYDAVKHLGQIICVKVPAETLQFNEGTFTHELFSGLDWPQPSSANGACLVLQHIFESRGGVFGDMIPSILDTLIPKLVACDDDSHTRSGIKKLFVQISRHHLHNVINSILKHTLPYTEVVESLLSCLGGDLLRDSSIEYLIDQLDRSLPYEEIMGRNKKQNPTKSVSLPSLAISCALQCVTAAIPPSDNHPLGGSMFKSLGISLMRVGSMFDVQTPQNLPLHPYRQAIELLQTVVLTYFGRPLNSTLDQLGVWGTFGAGGGIPVYTDAVAAFAMLFCKHRENDVGHLVSVLNHYLPSIYDMQRLTVVVFFAQLVKDHGTHNDVLLEVVMNSLRSKLVDPMPAVRQHSVRGLANIVFVSSNQIERYSASVLSSLMGGMDDQGDNDDLITLEAMSGLAKFLDKVEGTNIQSIFINICLRVRPCFEKSNPEVRSASIHLFGVLGRFGTGDASATYAEQAHSNFIPILLHLNDDQLVVRNACKSTLKLLSPHLTSPDIDHIFQKHLLEDSNLHFVEFINNLAKLMVGEFPDKINFYVMSCVSFFKSEWSVIRCNAALFAGFLLSNLNEESRSAVSKEHVCSALIQLLKDTSPEVRAKSSEAISLLHQF